jgi:purine-nucleoside phosphorylase
MHREERYSAVDLQGILTKLRPLFPVPPKIALVLGSGLGHFAAELEDSRSVRTADLPGYPRSTVEGHSGAVYAGKLHGKSLLCFQGRVHYYEGYSSAQILLPARIAHALGAEIFILTNASGGIHPRLKPGSFLLLEDQIDLQFRRPEPLHCTLESERAPFLRDGSPYSRRLLQIAAEAAERIGIPIHSGILAVVTGPSYETPAEISMMRFLGADAVCMSTAPEAVEGARLGMEVLGISCVTNSSAGSTHGQPSELKKLDHGDVIAAANRVSDDFKRLLKEIIQTLPG